MIKVNHPPPWFDTVRLFMKVGTCSETMSHALNRSLDHPHEPEETAATALAGGMLQQGYQCGLLWGASLAAGAEAFAKQGPTLAAQVTAVTGTQAVVKKFTDRYKTADCFDLTDLDWRTSKGMVKYMATGGPARCFNMAGRFAKKAYLTLNEALDGEPQESVDGPVSCAAMVLEKLGASPAHQVMAAGFAGGLGLHGGGCGALGAVLWYVNLRHLDSHETSLDFGDRALHALTHGFIKQTDAEYECAAITGRTFERIADHAEFLHNGGCAALIEALVKHGTRALDRVTRSDSDT